MNESIINFLHALHCMIEVMNSRRPGAEAIIKSRENVGKAFINAVRSIVADNNKGAGTTHDIESIDEALPKFDVMEFAMGQSKAIELMATAAEQSAEAVSILSRAVLDGKAREEELKTAIRSAVHLLKENCQDNAAPVIALLEKPLRDREVA